MERYIDYLPNNISILLIETLILSILVVLSFCSFLADIVFTKISFLLIPLLIGIIFLPGLLILKTISFNEREQFYFIILSFVLGLAVNIVLGTILLVLSIFKYNFFFLFHFFMIVGLMLINNKRKKIANMKNPETNQTLMLIFQNHWSFGILLFVFIGGLMMTFLAIPSLPKQYIIYLLFWMIFIAVNGTIILNLVLSKEVTSPQLLTIVLSSFFLQLIVQLAYPTVYALNHDVLLSEFVTETFLFEGSWLTSLENYNYTNAAAYSAYPGMHILIAICFMVTRIPLPTLHKFIMPFVSPISLYFIARSFECFLNSKRISYIATYIFSLTPWFIWFYSHAAHEPLAFLFFSALIMLLIQEIEENKWSMKNIPIGLLIVSLIITHHILSIIFPLFVLFLLLSDFISRISQSRPTFSFSTQKLAFWGLFSITLAIFFGNLSETPIFNHWVLSVSVVFLSSILKAIPIFTLIVLLSVIFISFFIILFLFPGYFYHFLQKHQSIIKWQNRKTVFLFCSIVIFLLFHLILFPMLLEKVQPSGLKNLLFVFIMGFSITLSIFLSGLGLLILIFDSWRYSIKSFRNMTKLSIFLFIGYAFFFPLLILGYIFVPWDLYPEMMFRERILIYFNLFASPLIAKTLSEFFNLPIRIKTPKSSNFFCFFKKLLYLSFSFFILGILVLGSAFYALPTSIVEYDGKIISSDDWRLDPDDWVSVAKWLKKNLLDISNPYIISSYRGKTIIEGISHRPVDTFILGNINSEDEFLLFQDRIWVISYRFFTYPNSTWGSSLNIHIFHYLEEYGGNVFKSGVISVFTT